jgi:nucleoside 2-deoxyribosyltransferase
MASFYVATKFENKNKALALMLKLEALGHSIAHKWVYQTEAYCEDMAQQAELDYLGVMRCDTLVVLLDEPFEPHVNTYVELGIALGAGKTIYIIGSYDKQCIFSHMPGIMRLANTKQLLATVQRLGKGASK